MIFFMSMSVRSELIEWILWCGGVVVYDLRHRGCWCVEVMVAVGFWLTERLLIKDVSERDAWWDVGCGD